MILVDALQTSGHSDLEAQFIMPVNSRTGICSNRKGASSEAQKGNREISDSQKGFNIGNGDLFLNPTISLLLKEPPNSIFHFLVS